MTYEKQMDDPLSSQELILPPFQRLNAKEIANS